jgi:hypothetical protein
MYHNNCIFLLFLCGKNLFAEMLMSCFAAAAQYHDFSSSGGSDLLLIEYLCVKHLAFAFRQWLAANR